LEKDVVVMCVCRWLREPDLVSDAPAVSRATVRLCFVRTTTYLECLRVA